MCTALQMLLQELPQKSFEMFEMTKLLGLYSLNYLDETFRYFGSFKESRENLFLKPLKKPFQSILILCRANLHQSR